jgi:membrane-associated PAP2 superfamily phosphatase
MDTSAGPIATYRRYWLSELIVLVALSIVAIVLFAATGLDIETMRPFYHPDHEDPWSDKQQPLWSLFYRSAPWVTASLAVTGVALFVLGMVRERSRRLRWYGVFVLLCVILGPGLIINLVLKDHWGRPRPRQMVEFGGRYEYVQPFVPAPFNTPRKSFPCGHCSVGYLYAAGWWLWRRKHPRWAAASLAGGLTLGTLLGIGRMAAGAHFLSDAVWSALIAYGVAHGLYYYVLRIPAREDARPTLYPLIAHSKRLKAVTVTAAVVIGLGIIGGGILANPHDRDLAGGISLANLPAQPETVEVVADTLDVELHLVDDPQGTVTSEGFLHGFGLPTNDIKAVWEFEAGPVPVLRYRVTLEGWFTDIDGTARIRIPVNDLHRITVRLRHGDIRVFYETHSATSRETPRLDLQTREGSVFQPQQ